MQNELGRAIDYSNLKIQYDTQCKKVLAQKPILARILQGTVKEYAGMKPEEIEQYIEGTPEISTVSVLPGETNSEQIRGEANEDSVSGEGTIYYDIRFFANVPKREEVVKIIINIEAQKKFRPGYEIVTRGIFYCARMISSQLGTEFVNSDYDAIKKVYSIWICMDAPAYIGNTITEYSLQKKDIQGTQPENIQAYDKLSVVIITLNGKATDQNEKDTQNQVTGMLNTLLSTFLNAEEKKRTLMEQYGIVTRQNGKEMTEMCNLSEWVEEKGIEKGLQRGIEKGIEKAALSLLNQGRLSDEEIIEVLEITAEKLEELKEKTNR